MRKKKHKKYGHKHGSFCVWRPNIKIFFDLIELNIKMSSVSNVSEDNSRSEEFSLKNIEELVDSEGQNWFKKAYVGKFLGLRYTDTSVGSLDKCEMLSKRRWFKAQYLHHSIVSIHLIGLKRRGS